MKVISLADLHLRFTVPGCVKATPTEWIDIQNKALSKVAIYAIENKVDAVLVGGDIFHSEQSTSFECINLFQQFVNELVENNIEVYIMAGNHDLPQHSSANISKSAVGTIFNSKGVQDMSCCSFCNGTNFDMDNNPEAPVIFKHTLCIPKDKIPPHVECDTPEDLLNKYPNARIIFTGDYHKSFYYENKDRFVFNSGCLTKQASDFENYETGCWLVEFETCYDSAQLIEYKWLSINIEQEFYHNAEIEKAIDESIEKFAMGIKKQSITLDFIESLKKELPNHEKKIQDKVNQWIEEIKQ